MLRTLHTATTAFTSGPDLCPGLQACHPREAPWGHFSLGSFEAGRLHSEPSTPQATVPSTSSCWQEPWTRCPGPDCSQDIPGMVPLLRSWPSVQSPGHHPRPHPARRLSGRTPLCPRSPRWFPGRVPWQGRPGLRGPCPGGLRPVSLQFGDLVTCRLRGPCLQGLVTCWPPCRGDQTCQRRVSLAGPEGTAGPGCDGSVRSACFIKCSLIQQRNIISFVRR